MTWRTVIETVDALDKNDIKRADQLMKNFPPGESLNQPITDSELKHQILSHAPNVEDCLRSLRELYLRKDKQIRDLV